MPRQDGSFRNEFVNETHELKPGYCRIFDYAKHWAAAPPTRIIVRFIPLPLHSREFWLQDDVLLTDIADAPGNPLKWQVRD